MDDYYTHDVVEGDDALSEEHNLFEQEVIRGDDDLMLMHHFLKHVAEDFHGRE